MTKIRRETDRFRAWAASIPAESRSGEWECDYGDWDALREAVVEFLKSPTADWRKDDINDALYAIARDNESELLAEEVANDADVLLELAGYALETDETEAKWQLAAQLGTLSSRTQEAEALLLRFVDDADEYTSRRALLALAELKSPQAEALAERAWNTGLEHERIAALSVLKDLGSDKLAQYVEMALSDGRVLSVEKTRKV